MAQRFATPFARIDSQKKTYFHSVHSQCLAPGSAIGKKGVQFGNPEMIRENRAIRADLRIDSRESGYLSPAT